MEVLVTVFYLLGLEVEGHAELRANSGEIFLWGGGGEICRDVYTMVCVGRGTIADIVNSHRTREGFDLYVLEEFHQLYLIACAVYNSSVTVGHYGSGRVEHFEAVAAQ